VAVELEVVITVELTTDYLEDLVVEVHMVHLPEVPEILHQHHHRKEIMALEEMVH